MIGYTAWQRNEPYHVELPVAGQQGVRCLIAQGMQTAAHHRGSKQDKTPVDANRFRRRNATHRIVPGRVFEAGEARLGHRVQRVRLLDLGQEALPATNEGTRENGMRSL